MAERDVTVDLSTKFEQELTCRVCQNKYTDARILSCHHSFCLACIESLPQELQQDKYVIHCPQCDHLTQLPDTGVADLPIATHILKRFELQALREKQMKIYKNALSEGECDVAYSRVMLLGAAGAGKSSLKRGLMHLPFDSKIDSTIVANIESVSTIRPVDYQWATAELRELTLDDELDELSQLLAHIPIRTETVLSNEAAVSLYPSLQSIIPSELVIEKQKMVTVDTIVADAIEKAISKPPVDQKPQPLFHVWDCGGQPQFLELLPAFLTSRTMFLLLFDASEDFNSRLTSVHYQQGRKVSGEEVNITILEFLHKWMASIHAHLARFQKGALPDYPRMIAIGTRGDKLSSEKKNEICKNVTHTIKKKAFADIFKRVCIVDNTTAGMGDEEDETYKYLREEIYKLASEKLVVKTPIKWVLFCKVLQVLVRESKNIISLSEACAIGVDCKINAEDVPKVLMFYHELGVILFYLHIQGLRDKVILNPKWFVDCLGKVLTLQERNDGENLQMWKLLHEKGILVEPLYRAVWRNCESIGPEEIMQLLVQFRLAVEVKTNLFYDPHVKQFFLPAALRKFTDDTSSDPKGSSLHITFVTGYVTPGFFTRLVATMPDSPKCHLYFHKLITLFHNRVIFQFLGTHVVLTELPSAIQVDVMHEDGTSNTEKQNICHDVKEVLEISCQEVENSLQSIDAQSHFVDSTPVSVIPREFKFICCDPKCPPSSDPHYLVLRSGKEQTCQDSLLCDENAYHRRTPTLREAYWFPGEIKKSQMLGLQSDSSPYNHETSGGFKIILLLLLCHTLITIGVFYQYWIYQDIAVKLLVYLCLALIAIHVYWIYQGWELKLVHVHLYVLLIAFVVGLFLALSMSTTYPDGMQVVGEKRFIVTGDDSPFTLDWIQFGLHIEVPEGSLPAGHRTELHVKAIIAGDFILPPDCYLVSGIYQISSSEQFKKNVTLRLPHAAIIKSEEEASHFKFYTADSSSGPPYEFKEMEGGTFTPFSNSGTIDVHHFCYYACGANISANQRFRYQVFYKSISNSVKEWNMVFTITKEEPSFIKHVKMEYHDYDQGDNHIVRLQENATTLKLESENRSISPWKMSPYIIPSQIDKDDLCKYLEYPEPQEEYFIPHCKYNFYWESDSQPTHLELQFKLIGSHGDKKFTVILPQHVSQDNESGKHKGADIYEKIITECETEGVMPSDEELLYHLHEVALVKSFCVYLKLTFEVCKQIERENPENLEGQKFALLNKWREMEELTWKGFIRPFALLRHCAKAKKLATEHCIYFEKDSKVLESCKDINNHY